MDVFYEESAIAHNSDKKTKRYNLLTGISWVFLGLGIVWIMLGFYTIRINVSAVGSEFENCAYFPEGINTEFVRVVNKVTIKMRVWERGSGETWACGSGACAAVVAAVLAGYCEKDTNVTVKLRGGDLTVNYHSDGDIELLGNVKTVYEGMFEI